MGAAYSVRVGPGCLENIGELGRDGGWGGRAAVVTDANTHRLFGPRVMRSLPQAGFAATEIVLPAGEATKTVATAHDIWRGLLAARIERGDTVVAVGGGVVGDLAGFAAATWLRGVRWAGVPTSLLAMVDSSLGGKTGADLPEGKNLVGAFHPPGLVLADTDALATLPDEEFRCGLAEVVKHGLIADPGLFDLCERGFAALRSSDPTELVSRAMAVKIRTIEEDPFERGIRASLNTGHTVGHGIEQATRFALRHGEAVAIGLVAEARLAERMGLAQAGLAARIAAALRGLGLPTAMPEGLDRQAFVAALQRDKKRSGGAVRFALPVRVGEVRTGVLVDAALIEEL
jgi:3-dehydroquinate synthase